MMTDIDPVARVRGCLLGGAVGDALGAPVEFMSTAELRAAFGADGIQEFAPAYGRRGALTDDTQMTLFTAEGIIRAQLRLEGKGICHVPSVIHHALLRWLYTQGERSAALPAEPDGWLITHEALFARRAPGMTCLSALRASKNFGDQARNDSKGCGAIMRIAPLGLFVSLTPGASGAPPRTYELACESAKTTHAHRESTLSSGFFALVVAHLMQQASLVEAIEASRVPLQTERGADLVISVIDRAVSLASSSAPSTPELVESLGGGWVAEEALAISLFCALRAESFEHGVRLAVNHGGDSDSTGSLTGQLLGTLGGDSVVPQRWLDELELRDVIETVATDLVTATGDTASLESRYPGW
ncbi:MAG: ADP-ribosylglycohydrolase family protein [Myxococcales bacterium]|nr:MAG: ADP-ribosylglycohydrolase family protein [Myxococcales bacterium]